jgi:1-acyl-sn-glycerol-3-phosphate acyltransferase
MAGVLRFLFFLLIVRPIVLVVLGLNVRHRERLPKRGPAIVVANHNSHLDTMVLMTLFPPGTLPRLRALASADYFLKNRLFGWFARRIIGIVPLYSKEQAGLRADRLAGAVEALDRGAILILFPEGTRGEPERIAAFKAGVAHLAQRRPDVPIIPVFLHGLGKALPKGESVLVPFFCDVFIGEAMKWTGERAGFMAALAQRINALAAEGRLPPWQ